MLQSNREAKQAATKLGWGASSFLSFFLSSASSSDPISLLLFWGWGLTTRRLLPPRRSRGDLAMAAANAPIAMREALTVSSSLLTPTHSSREISPVTKAELMAPDSSLFSSLDAAHQPGDRAPVRHLHPRHHGVGEIHLRPRDLPAEQRRHRRHGHARAAPPQAHHRRLRPHEPQHPHPRPQRFLPT